METSIGTERTIRVLFSVQIETIHGRYDTGHLEKGRTDRERIGICASGFYNKGIGRPAGLGWNLGSFPSGSSKKSVLGSIA